MISLFKIILRFFFLLSLFIINIVSLIKLIRYVNKSEIIMFSEGGFGHIVQDSTNFNYIYPAKKKLTIHFVKNNNNFLINKCIKKVNIIFLKTYFSIFNSIFFDYISNKNFVSILIFLIKKFYKKKLFLSSYQELDNKFIYLNDKFNLRYYDNFNEEYNRSYLGLLLSHSINLKEYERVFYLNSNLIEKIKKNNKIFNFKSKKYVMFYYRKKKQILGERYKELRDGGNISNYYDGFQYLIDKGYKILFNGDVDYLNLNNITEDIKNKFKNNIIFHNDLNLSTDKYYLLSLSLSNFFIGNAGGGSYVHLYNNIPGLILDYFPYWTTVRNSVIYFKPIIDHNNIDLKFNKKIMLNFSPQNKDEEIHIRDMKSHEILDAIINFVDCYSTSKFLNRNNNQDKFHRQLPDWYFLKYDNNSFLSDVFIKKHWE